MPRAAPPDADPAPHLPLKAVPVAEDWARRTHHLALRTGEDAPVAARTLVEALRSG